MAKTEKLEWIAGDFPAPEWMQKQDRWFVFADLTGTVFFQGSTEEGQPVSVIVPKGQKVELKNGVWTFDGSPVRIS
jgi:hypothetical protein